MRIGVTGSAGFLGANLLRHLHGCGDGELVAFYSRRRRNPLTAEMQLADEHLDVTSAEEVLDKTRGLDLLYHLAGSVDYDRRNLRRTWAVNVLGARNVLEAARRNGIRKLVCVSSISVLGVPPAGGGLADESNQPYGSAGNPISFRGRAQALEAAAASASGDYSFGRAVRVPYFDSKLAAYELALEYYRRHELPVVVVLPGTAVGAGDVGFSISSLVSRVFENRLRFTLPGGTSFVAAEDVAAGTRLAGARGRNGESYVITGRERDNLSYRQFMQLVARVASVVYNRRVSSRFLTIPAFLGHVLAPVIGGLVPSGELNEGLIRSGCVTHRFSGRKAERELGYVPRVALEDAVRQCIDFYLDYQRE
ncbi:MAG: NAD-dependent epimerase/dehydratase family protein, partial [Spirochaetales bacterium]|nr:NAD-dependent epimerase/dehydratase family protein [Spirochaetales bacterium]